MRKCLFSLLIFFSFSSFISTLAAQEEWKEIQMENPRTQEPMAFLKAIGIPAQAVYDGKKLKAYVFIWGREKSTGIGYPTMAVHVDGIDELVPDKEYNQFRGPDLSDAAIKSRTLIVTIKNRNGVHSVSNRVGLDGSPFPHSIALGEVFGSNYAQTRADKQVWRQFILDMSAGFDEGHLSIGGRVLSKKIEVEFSGNGIGPLLKDLIQFVGQ